MHFDAITNVRTAASKLALGVRRDHATMLRLHATYGNRANEGAVLARDLVEKVGLQLMAAYRVMRFFSEVDAKLAARVTSRLIRHLYGSDIHWEAAIAPGVMIVHGMGMAIARAARVEEGAQLFQHCTLGEGRHPDTQETGAPIVGTGAVIGAGAVLLGPITIGARSKIMPGCVVVRSVPPDSIVEAPRATVRPRHARSRSDEDHALASRPLDSSFR